jgi:modulator of FtsH protease HflK
MPPNDRRSGKPDDVIEIEQMLRQLRSRVPRLGVGAGVLALIVAALWLSTGFYTIAPDEMGVVMRFGKMVRVTDPGPHLLLPWPFESVIKTNVTEVKRIEIGFRTTFAGPPAQYEAVPEESHMLTGDENIVSLEFIVQYQVKRGKDGLIQIEDYLFNLRPAGVESRSIGHTQGRLDGVVKQVAEAAMREVVGGHTIDSVLTEGKEAVQQECRELMQQILDSYGAGVQVNTVQLQDVQPPTPEVSKYFKDVASAREDKVRSLQEAEAYTNDLLPKARGEAEAIKAGAEGYAQSRVADATGQANRFLSILKEYEQARQVTRERLYLETMEDVLAPAEKIVVDSKASEQMVPYLPLRSEGLRVGEAAKPSTP